MTEAVLVALISGVLSLAGVIITVMVGNKKTTKQVTNQVTTQVAHKLEVNQAVTDTKIEELTREVRLHNGFAQRMPVVEEQIKVINHRIEDLEEFHKPTT